MERRILNVKILDHTCPYKNIKREFSGGPVVKALQFHCRTQGFNPCLVI